MKILQIKIDGFGRWVDANLAVDPHLQVFCGPNEAGKSTLVEFIKGVLFGFKNAQGKNKYKQYLPKGTTVYGGSLLVEQDGQRYWVNRSGKRSGGKVTITHEDGRGTRMTIDQLCGQLNRQLVEDIFSFDQQELSRIDELSDTELRQDLQRVGAVGSAHWQGVKADLTKQSRRLYKRRGRNPQLNQALTRVKELRERLASAQEKTAAYRQLVQERAELTTQQAAVDQQVTAARQQHDQLLAQQRLWPVFEQWQQVNSHHQELDQLTADDLTRVQQLQAALPETQRQVKQAEADQADLQRRVAALNSPDLTAYQEQWAGANDPATKLHRLLLSQLTHDKQAAAADQAHQTLTEIQQRLGHDELPQPLSPEERQQLAGLQTPLTRQPAAQKQLGPVVAAGVIGLLFLLAGLLMKNVVVDLLGIVALAVAGVLAYQQQQRVTEQEKLAAAAAAQRQQERTRFGQQHGLTAFAPDQWLAIQPDLEKAQTARQTSLDFKREDDRLAGELQHWQTRFANIHADSAAEFWQRVLDYLDQCSRQVQRLVDVQQRATRQAQTAAELQQQLSRQENQLRQLYQQVGVHNRAEFQTYLRKRQAAQNESATKHAAESQLTPQQREALSQYADKDELTQRVAAAATQLAHCQAKQTDLAKRAEEVKVQIKGLVEDGTVTRLEQELANAEEAARQLTNQWLTMVLASQWIDRSLALASADRYPQIIQRATQYFATLTDNRYQTISLGGDQLTVAGPAGRQFEVGELSTGTAEQLYVALRLGFVSVMNDTIQFPLVIDDGFVNFDNDRKARVMDLLKQVAISSQVIYLTADDRVLDNNDLAITTLKGAKNND